MGIILGIKTFPQTRCLKLKKKNSTSETTASDLPFSQNFSESGHTRTFNAPSIPLSNISQSETSNLKCTLHTPLENIKRRDSRKFHAQSPKDSQISSWLVTTDKMVRNNKPSESSDKLLRSFTFLPDKTHSKSCLRPSFKVVPEKTQQELVQEVLSEDKLLMFHHLEESTRLSISFAVKKKDEIERVAKGNR